MEVAFWPAAASGPWDWGWRAYPGAWLLLAGVAAAFAFARRGFGVPPTATEARARRRQLACFLSGLGVLWLALDWPLGALAGGYLLSAAALQYLLLTLAAAPLLLLALPRREHDDRARAPSRFWRPPLPLLGAGSFAAVLFGTSVPGVLDLLRASAVGSTLLALLWLGAALALWWPLLRRQPPMGYMAGIAYLFVPFLLPKIPGLAYIVASDPLYETYAGAPRVAGLALSATADQRAAGAMLWSAGTAMVFVSLGVLFFHWYRDERRVASPGSLQLPADPEVVDALFAIPGAWTALERVIGGIDAALPAERPGTELRFLIRERSDGAHVVLQVHALLERSEAAAVEQGIARDLAHYVARLQPDRRAVIEARLTIEVVPFRARVS